MKFHPALLPLALLLTAAAVAVPAGSPEEAPAERFARDLQQARAAVKGRDYATALAAYERLVRQAPYHPGFHYEIARLSAVTGQAARAASELERAATLGYDYGEALDAALADAVSGAVSARAASLVQKTRRATADSRVAFTIGQRDLTPEGIAYDAKGKSLYLGSTWRSKIVRLDAAGRLSDFAAERQDGLRAVLGLRIDAARRTLWAVSVPNPLIPPGDPGEVGTAAVFRFNLDTGRLTGKFELREPGVRHILNDLDVSPRGDLFVTDSLRGAIYVIWREGTSLELLVPPGALLQPNGIAVSGNAAALFVACTDGIHRVNLKSKTTSRLAQPDDICLGGIDGLYRVDRGLIGVQNGQGFTRLVRIALNRSADAVQGMTVLENRNPRFELPTTGAIAGRSFYYMANTQIYRTGKDGNLLPPDELRDLVILRLDLEATTEPRRQP